MPKRIKAKKKAETPTETVEERLTPQQEKFAQLVASGMNQSAAYRAAYDAKRMKATTINNEASRLARNPHITIRVAEIRKPVIEKARYDLKDAMAETENAMNLGLQLGHPSAVVSAIALRSKLNGLDVEPRKNDREPFTELTDDELKRIIAEADRILATSRPGSTGKGSDRAVAKAKAA